MFSEPTRVWFSRVFGEPTEAQRLAWPAIGRRENVLVIAPTGSGKTLSAFLFAIDSLLSRSAADHARKGVRVLYISPLKALGVDVAKNLDAPLAGIREQIDALGSHAPQVTVATRSGDTTPKERRAIVSHPPDILVTTPESLYLMLTSKARGILKTVDTVIVDEVHAVAGTKRGAHLALSLERLDDLLERPAQRIGLSATVNPPERAAKFLAGALPVTVIATGGKPALDITVVEPAKTLGDGPVANGRRKGGAGEVGSTSAPITGVTPAMQRLAERKARERDGQGDPQSATTGETAKRWGEPLLPGTPVSEGAHDPSEVKSAWPAIQRHILDEILSHRTTLVFVNSRGLCERLTAQINDLYAQRLGKRNPVELPTSETDEPAHYHSTYGSTTMKVGAHGPDEQIAMAHHGSVSKDRRKQIEERLKSGRLRCVVATSSLELGIDMGSVDLVIQVTPPLSVSSGLQRVGRADHRVGGVSHAVMYPVTREQIIGMGASVEGMLNGAIEPLHMPMNPLDVLAQQTVAAASLEPIAADDWYATVRRAAPFASLDRAMFDAVVGMLTGAYNSEDFSAFRPPLMFDEDSAMISARPGAQRLAVTSGGTIPDRGLYTVVLPEAEAGTGPRRVGELDEEMVYETRVGDIITLGTTNWQVQEITNDRVVVVPAPGRSARLPFWYGEGNGRDYSFGMSLGEWVHDIAAGLQPAHGNVGNAPESRFSDVVLKRLRADGLDANAMENLAAFLSEQRASTGVIPSSRAVVVERCREEEGDWRVIIHTPFGRRVHEPWALAINMRLTQRYGFDGQIFAADDGIVLRLPDGEGGIDVAALIDFDPDDIQRIVENQVSGSVLFAARFREIAARALFMPRNDPGKRVPLWQQRLRAAQLLAAARTRKNFPLLLETARECLQDVYDVPALREVLTRIRGGAIDVHACETQVPSPMAEHLLFGFVGSVMYQYDVPQAERNAQLLSMDPLVLERLLGTDNLAQVLDTQVIDSVGGQLASKTFWNELDKHDLRGRVNRYAKTHGPFTADRLLSELEIDAQTAVELLGELRDAGELINGRFDERLDPGVAQWVHADVLKRIRSQSLAKARAAIKPVEPERYEAFLVHRQGVGSVGGERLQGLDGLLRAIEQLEGVALPMPVWERHVFPARVRDYTPTLLDELVGSGDVVWVGDPTGSGEGGDEAGRVMFFPADSPQLQVHAEALESSLGRAAAPESDMPLTVRDAILLALHDGGAYTAHSLEERAQSLWQANPEPEVNETTGEVMATSWSHSRFEQTLWSLVWHGFITNTSLQPVRSMSTHTGGSKATVRSHRLRMRARIPTRGMFGGGLWSLVRAQGDASHEEAMIDLIGILLDRYGIIAPNTVSDAGVPGGFSAIYPVLKRMEEKGTLLRGAFVKGFGAAQFAERETVDLLRHHIDSEPVMTVTMDVCDPANLYGSSLEWPAPAILESNARTDSKRRAAVKPIRRPGSLVVLRQGRAVLYAALGSGRIVAFESSPTMLKSAATALEQTCSRLHGASITFRDCNGVPLQGGNAMSDALRHAGFTPSPQGLRLYR